MYMTAWKKKSSWATIEILPKQENGDRRNPSLLSSVKYATTLSLVAEV